MRGWERTLHSLCVYRERHHDFKRRRDTSPDHATGRDETGPPLYFLSLYTAVARCVYLVYCVDKQTYIGPPLSVTAKTLISIIHHMRVASSFWMKPSSPPAPSSADDQQVSCTIHSGSGACMIRKNSLRSEPRPFGMGKRNSFVSDALSSLLRIDGIPLKNTALSTRALPDTIYIMITPHDGQTQQRKSLLKSMEEIPPPHLIRKVFFCCCSSYAPVGRRRRRRCSINMYKLFIIHGK